MKSITLIDSTYEPKEAKEVLLSLIRDKIEFLNRKILRKAECEGLECTHSKQRVAELTKELEELRGMFNVIESENVTCELKSDVRLTIRNSEGVEVELETQL
ncbi:hypothetical protein [Phaeocystidibacter luteus]|uniref:Uncharacterized protein n=1 Tax=Phaeocystidibacter luteus TaxID=911197 RepID=A0A6N6RIY6_9FLAO|nr:hypothetical protein [Phaeocystidibacter luteus]KAB2810374.1 hypothetical protein F8C67_07240 [Phaeocystidibacter luteus]